MVWLVETMANEWSGYIDGDQVKDSSPAHIASTKELALEWALANSDHGGSTPEHPPWHWLFTIYELDGDEDLNVSHFTRSGLECDAWGRVSTIEIDEEPEEDTVAILTEEEYSVLMTDAAFGRAARKLVDELSEALTRLTKQEEEI